MRKRLKKALLRIFNSFSKVNAYDENWDWDESWSIKKEKHDQWDFYTIFIFIKEHTLIDQIVKINKKYSIATPYLHITVHYSFTIKDGFSEDDIFRILTQFLSEFDFPTFTIQDTLWLHKNRYANGNIIALGIDQSGDFEKIRIGLTKILHPYINATTPFEKEPQYKSKARPHISIAYKLNYHSAQLLSDELIINQKCYSSNLIFHSYPLTTITLRKGTMYFDFDFKEKRWKQ
jgi:hypothetical protein